MPDRDLNNDLRARFIFLAIGLFLLNINIYLVQLQIMGVDMTDETGLKVFQEPRIMGRRIMAFGAFRYGLMHPAVTCDAG